MPKLIVSGERSSLNSSWNRVADALGKHVGAVVIRVGCEERELVATDARGTVEAALAAV